MKGVILTGGKGTRMGQPAEVLNKHALLCYDQPVVHYPLQTLAAMGCSDVLIVGSPTGVGDIAATVKDGEQFGVNVSYRVQPEPNGVAGALIKARGFTDGQFALVLGDVYLDPAPTPQDEPTLFWHSYARAHEHSVWSPEEDMIREKVTNMGNRAIIAYQYDERVYDFIRDMTPAESGELEIVDIHNFYRENGARFVEYRGYFADMGTPDGLLRAANHEQERQEHV